MSKKSELVPIKIGLGIISEIDELHSAPSFQDDDSLPETWRKKTSVSIYHERFLSEDANKDSPKMVDKNKDQFPQLNNEDQPPQYQYQQKNEINFEKRHTTEDKVEDTTFNNETFEKKTKIEKQVTFVEDNPQILKAPETKKYKKRKTIGPNQYFVQESEQDQQKNNEHEINFRATIFIEFFIYHIIFCVLGPLSFIVLYPIAGRALTYNMGFAGFNRFFFYQTMQWGSVFSVLFLWFYMDHGTLSAVELYMLLSALFLRICIIASKYGSTHSNRIKVLKKKYLTYDELVEDYLLYNWASQTNSVIKRELVAVIKRREIDTALFLFNFMTKISEETKKRLTKSNKDPAKPRNKLSAKKASQSENSSSQNFSNIGESPKTGTQSAMSFNDDSQNSSGITEPQIEELIEGAVQSRKQRIDLRKKASLLSITLENLEKFEMLSGINLAREIIIESRKKGIPRILTVSLVLGLLRAIVPLLDRLDKEELAIGDTLAQHFICMIFIVCNSFFFSMNISFLLTTLSDLMKKFYLMTQLSGLISVEKLGEYVSTKLYPTINIFDPLSLRAWTTLRMIFMDYGRKYSLRMNPNISIFLLFYLVISANLFLQIFGFVLLRTDEIFTLMHLIESLLVFGLVFRSLIVGANINEHFRIHKNIIQKNKTITLDLLQLEDVYFSAGRNNFEASNVLYQEGVAKIKELIRLSGLEPGSHLMDKIIQDHLAKLLAFNDSAIEELKFEEENNSVKIMGFLANKDMVKRVFVAIFSLGIAILQRKLNF